MRGLSLLRCSDVFVVVVAILMSILYRNDVFMCDAHNMSTYGKYNGFPTLFFHIISKR